MSYRTFWTHSLQGFPYNCHLLTQNSPPIASQGRVDVLEGVEMCLQQVTDNVLLSIQVTGYPIQRFPLTL